MNKRPDVFRVCALAIACAILLRLAGGGLGAMVAQALGHEKMATVLLYLGTGRVACPAAPQEQIPNPTQLTSPSPEEDPVEFTLEDGQQIQVGNFAGVDVDIPALLQMPLDWDLTEQSPTVLILHTHGSESYTGIPQEAQSSGYRSLDTAYNMVSMGDALTRYLTEAGIGVIHDRTLYDYPSYNDAYNLARTAIQEYLAQYPSVSLVIDLHRDAAEDAAGNQVAFTAQIDGQIAANESAKTQLKSGIDTAEDSRETINENLATAEQSYAITQNEVYPDTDATYAAQLESAAVGIDSAQMQLDYYTVEAPISGVIESVSVEEDQMVSAGSAAYVISNKESMTVTFQVTEEAKNVLAAGDPVTVERNGDTYEGTITEVGTMANAQTHLFTVKASVSGASDKIPNGVTVKVYATTHEEENKLIIPYDALYFSAGSAYVYCVEDGTIVRTPVTVGLMSDTQAVIEEGLSEDSQVVGNWSSRLRDGAPAEVVSVNGETPVTEEPEEPAETAETAPAEEEAE